MKNLTRITLKHSGLCLCLLLLSGACSKGKAKIETKTRVQVYFDPVKKTLVGFNEIHPVDPLEYSKGNMGTTTIFWKTRELSGRLTSPNPAAGVHGITYSESLGKIIVLTVEGVFSISPKTEKWQTIWNEPKNFIKVLWARDKMGKRIAITGYDSDKKSRFFGVIDLATGRAHTMAGPVTPEFVYFEDETAVFTVRSDILRLTTLNGKLKVTEQKNVVEDGGAVVGKIGDQRIRLSKDQKRLNVGDKLVDLGGEGVPWTKGNGSLATLPVWVLKHGAGFSIWVLTDGGRLLSINAGKTTLIREQIDPARLIGIGAYDGGVWLASNTGTVEVLGDISAMHDYAAQVTE